MHALRTATTIACAVALGATAAAQSPLTVDPAEAEYGDCPGFMPEGCGIAVLHGDPAEPNADILFRVPGGAMIPRHWHTSAERMVLVSGVMTIDYDGAETQRLDVGEYAFGPAKLPHSAECVSEEACVLFIAFEEPLDAIEGAPE